MVESMKSVFKKFSKISDRKISEIIKLFALDLPASKISEIVGISTNSIEYWCNYFREVISYYQEHEKNEILKGEMELDESYFGANRVRGKRGRGALGKVKVFGLLKRNGKVYSEIVDDVSAKTLLPIIRNKVDQESIINTDGWKSYDGLVDLGFEKHHRVIHSDNEFARGTQHINGIESFRSFTKRRMTKFNGTPRHKFELYLKESEFRFNCGILDVDIYKQLRKLVKKFNLLG